MFSEKIFFNRSDLIKRDFDQFDIVFENIYNAMMTFFDTDKDFILSYSVKDISNDEK